MGSDDERRADALRVGNDNTHSAHKPHADPQMSQGLASDLLMGLRFFSRLPTGNAVHQIPSLSRIALALPFASLVIGIFPSLALIVGTLLRLPPMLTAFIAIGSAIVVTGAMAEDAVGDSADGLVGGQTPQRRLEIFKDSRLGTYGVTSIIMYVGMRVTILSAFLAQGVLPAVLLWLGANVLARSSAIWLTVALPAARIDGASASSGRVSKRAFVIGAGFAVLLTFVMAAPFVGIIGWGLTIAAIAAVVWAWSRMCDSLVGGQTGDLIGGLQAVLEIVALIAFMIFLGPK